MFAGPRVSKADPRICAYGTVDELNAVLGTLRASGVPDDLNPILEKIQVDLFSIGAELSTPDPDANGVRFLGKIDIEKLEKWIDQLEESLPPLKQFILPGGSVAAAMLHLGRTVCRRAEREVVSLASHEGVADCSTVIVYLNRLSDLLFVMARRANQLVGESDVPWHRPTT
ncbi:MAG: cob(I)yrinic acid a,c-diamide adenosyltransferase [Candidatus Moraniibacteriota bacterium]|nr:MAG: cob(I)yrinic acid a,c-diamide adenosyltransferase [Candidatus Moranbacteria bacterium]